MLCNGALVVRHNYASVKPVVVLTHGKLTTAIALGNEFPASRWDHQLKKRLSVAFFVGDAQTAY